MRLFDRTYLLSLQFKISVGLAETALGLLILFLSPDGIEDLGQFLNHLSQVHASTLSLTRYLELALSGSRIFIAGYLLIHGVPKLLLGFALLRRKLWAYPVALVTLGGFMLFQVYEIAAHHSIAMLVLTIVDLGIAWMIWREFKRDREKFQQPLE